MKIETTPLPGVVLIEPARFGDSSWFLQRKLEPQAHGRGGA